MSFETQLLEVIARGSASLNIAFIKSIEETVQATDWDRFQQLFAEGRFVEASTLVDWQEFDPQPILKGILEEATGIQGQEITRLSGKVYAFDMKSPEVAEWLQKYAAEDIKYISDASRQAIHDIVTRGYMEGYTVQEQAALIREQIGLLPDHVDAVQNLREQLWKEGLSIAETEKRCKKYAQQLLNYRADTIAINEASEGCGRGQYLATKDAYERGVLGPQYEGFRIITPDERLCEECAAVAGEARPLPDGVYPSSGSTIAKKHTRCRCVEGLREKKMQSKQRKKMEGLGTVVFDTQALKEKDGVIYVPTVPIVEGVYEQWGLRVFRSYQEFSPYTHWLNGIPVVANHDDPRDPNVRRLGQIFDVENKPEGRKAGAVTRFYTIDLTQRELDEIRSRKPHDGSLKWACYIEEEAGEWVNPSTGETLQYDFKEVGPFDFIEYSFVKQGVIGTDAGAGFNVQCKNCHSNHAPGGASMEQEQIKEMIAEAQKPLLEKIAALEQRNAELEGRQKKTDESLEADRQARAQAQEQAEKDAFFAELKPGYTADAQKAEALWQECKAQGFLSWKQANREKIVVAVQSYQPRGSPVAGGEQAGVDRPLTSEEMAQRQDKIFGRVL